MYLLPNFYINIQIMKAGDFMLLMKIQSKPIQHLHQHHILSYI